MDGIRKYLKNTILYKYCIDNNCDHIRKIIYKYYVLDSEKNNFIYNNPKKIIYCYIKIFELDPKITNDIISSIIISTDILNSCESYYFFIAAIRKKKYNLLKKFIDNGFNLNPINFFDDCLLYIAYMIGDWHVIKLFLDSGIHLSSNNVYLLSLEKDEIDKYIVENYNKSNNIKILSKMIRSNEYVTIKKLFSLKLISDEFNKYDDLSIKILVNAISLNKNCNIIKYFLNINSDYNFIEKIWNNMILMNNITGILLLLSGNYIKSDTFINNIYNYNVNIIHVLLDYEWKFPQNCQKISINNIYKNFLLNLENIFNQETLLLVLIDIIFLK